MIGTILSIPLPQMLNTMMTARATIASNQLVVQFETAEGARPRPIAMMMGPVTTGGKNFITLLTPIARMIPARMK